MLGVWRICIHLGCIIPFGWLGYGILTEDAAVFGSDPVKEIEHFLGYTALVIFFVMFGLGILLQLLGKNHYQILRRPLGLWAFAWAALHIGCYVWLDLGLDISLFIHEITRRPYLLMGFIAFVILSIMALTSLPRVKQTLGKMWGKVHQLAYIALVLAVIHYYQSVKSISVGAVVMTSGVMIIIFWKYAYPYFCRLFSRLTS